MSQSNVLEIIHYINYFIDFMDFFHPSSVVV